MPDPANIEAHQQQRFVSAQQVNREAAVRRALAELAPHADDTRQSYVEVLRRLQEALTLELAQWNAPPSVPPQQG